MSILRIAVENHLRHNRMTIRELIEAAYWHRFEKTIPQMTLDQLVANWENGANNVPFLYDFILGAQHSE